MRGSFGHCLYWFILNLGTSATTAFRGRGSALAASESSWSTLAGCASPITRRAVRSVFSSVVTASRRSSSVVAVERMRVNRPHVERQLRLCNAALTCILMAIHIPWCRMSRRACSFRPNLEYVLAIGHSGALLSAKPRSNGLSHG